jgi:hypothetical protein
MANTLLTISMITREALRILENELTFTKQVNREYDDAFAIAGAKIGDTINIRKPSRYTVRTGTTMSVQNHTDQSVALVLDQQKGTDISFTSKELTLSLDDFSKRVLEPQVAAVANAIDRDGLDQYKYVANAVGTPATVPNALFTYLSAGAFLDDMAAPRSMRKMVIGPWMQATIVDALKGLFQSANQISEQYEEGMMGRGAGFDWYMDQNIVTHTVATHSGTPLTNGASSEGDTTVTTDGWTSGGLSMTVGDIFTIADVYSVNPQHRQSTGQLQKFVVTAAITDTTGDAVIAVYPTISASGAYQTVNALPADGKAITVIGATTAASPQGLAFHRDAFVMGCADLQLPGGVDRAARISSKRLGMSVRMVRAYDINNDAWPCRLDVLYGWKTVYPELACRILS